MSEIAIDRRVERKKVASSVISGIRSAIHHTPSLISPCGPLQSITPSNEALRIAEAQRIAEDDSPDKSA